MLQTVKRNKTYFYWCQEDGYTTRSMDIIKDHLKTVHHQTDESADFMISESMKYCAEIEV